MLEKPKIKELSLFLNIEAKSIGQMDKSIQKLPGFAKWINIAVDDWIVSKVNERKKKEIELWFKKNDKYLFELCDVNSRPPKKKISKKVIEICKKHKVNSILDYGGGIGEESIYAAKAGLQTFMADLPSLTFDFAKWRNKYYGLNTKFIEIKNDYPLKSKVDAITCFEVIQHLFNPQSTLKYLIKHLRPGGLLFITTRFKNLNYPIALKKNFKYSEGMENYIQKNNMRLINKIYQYGKGKKSKYLYVYQKGK